MSGRRVPFQKYGAGIGLHRTAMLCARMGIDPAAWAARCGVIVGSNGKGGTAAMTQAVLTAHGRRTALFISPHLSRFNERFRLDGEDIDDQTLSRHWARAQAAGEAHMRAFPHDTVGGFEFLFLVALSWIEEAQPDVLVMEAGIGGRYDPTRLLRGGQAALVSLDLEHTDLLGDTLAAIAMDKADVCPPGGRLLTGSIPLEITQLLETYVALNDVTLEPSGPGDWRIQPDGQVAIRLSRDRTFSVTPPIPGEAQASNMALACRLADRLLEGALSPETAARGLQATRWPGRLEIIHQDPLTVIDVGHTPAAIMAALEGLSRMGRFGTLICGASHDKSAVGMITLLAPHFSTIVCTAARHKGSDPAIIAEAARSANPAARILQAPAAEAAWSLARDHTPRDTGIYIGGGLFLAMELAAAVRGEPLVDPFF